MTAMKVDVQKKDDQTAEIKLEISPEQAGQEYNKAWRRLGQRLNIPGFRRGKAPRNIVEKTVGVERIKQEAMDRLLPHAFADAISEHQLDVVAPPQISGVKFDLNAGINVQASVELRPEAELCSFDGVKVDVPEYKLPEDAEKSELDNIVTRFSTLEPVIDRPAEANDIVNIDFSGYNKGEAIRGGAARNYRLDLAENNFIEGFADQIVGHKLGEDFSIQVTFPEDYHDKSLSGKPVDFQIKINEINRKVTPEINDDLAKKCGPYEDLNALKAEIAKVLENAVEQENTFRKQKAVVDYVLDNSKVEIPESMINREAKLLVEEVKQRLKGEGVSWDQFVESQGKDNVFDNLREEATKRIKTSLVFGSIAKKEGIAVTDQEFTQQVQEMARSRGVDEKNIMRHLANNFEAAQALSDQILSQKIIDFLLGKASFTLVPDTGEDTAAKKGAKAGKGKKEPASVAAQIEGEEFDVLEEDNES
ncbi:MAG: trigger factor [Candidatus Melainabacteria bacterium]